MEEGEPRVDGAAGEEEEGEEVVVVVAAGAGGAEDGGAEAAATRKAAGEGCAVRGGRFVCSHGRLAGARKIPCRFRRCHAVFVRSWSRIGLTASV